MKKFLTLLICFLALGNAAFCESPIKNDDFEKIYNSLTPADFEYIFSLDPHQPEDYQKYHVSPYPLLRTGVDFVFQGTKIPAGYYLLTPRDNNGVHYVLFKQEGKVKYIIPAYKKELVDPTFYNMHVQTPKKTKWQKVCDFGNQAVGRVSKDSRKIAPPKVYIDVNEIGTEFWQVILYYGNDKYYLVFKQR